eukprot:scaffold10578_cov158-Skeletonema_menzelii.AAC.5
MNDGTKVDTSALLTCDGIHSAFSKSVGGGKLLSNLEVEVTLDIELKRLPSTSMVVIRTHGMAENRVTFVDLPLSNETKAFVDGPELGGLNPGYRHHVHVPTTSSVMVVMSVLLLAFQCTF